MNLQSKYSDLMLNLLVALAISLVVNFSYVLLLIVEQKGEGQPRPARASVVTRSEEGVLHVSPDGHGTSSTGTATASTCRCSASAGWIFRTATGWWSTWSPRAVTAPIR